MNIIYYQTKTQFENAGDALINNALINELRGYGVLKCNCSKNVPEEFIKSLGIKENEKVICNNEIRLFFLICKDAIKKGKNKIFIFSGLGHQWGGGIKQIFKVLVSSSLFAFYRVLGVKIVRIGMSVGPFSKSLAKTEKIRSLFVSDYYVRDTKSFEYCKEIGIKKVKLCPDMSWIYMDNHKVVCNRGNIVTVNLRGSILNEDNNIYKQRLLNKTEEILKEISRKIDDMEVHFVYQVKRDFDFCKYSYNYFKDKFNCKFYEEQISLASAKYYYERSVFNISSRMHSLLLGYKYGSLPIAVIDEKQHTKISQTFHDCGIKSLIIDINKENSNDNIKKIVNCKDEMFEMLIRTENGKKEEIKNIISKIIN